MPTITRRGAGARETAPPAAARALRHRGRLAGRYGRTGRAVATSVTVGRLAGIAGPAGPVRRPLPAPPGHGRRAAQLTTTDSAARPAAGALVADAAMDPFEAERLDVCPWALREGVVLRRLDRLDAGAE
ncbi:hypothetical protein [Nonomuraea sp. NPDC049309]|uniref:hypothetical protein n=1 Tax=Nonomuraea sp. NPDC049309 TaxID=3364350 RepID=UPI0037143CC7